MTTELIPTLATIILIITPIVTVVLLIILLRRSIVIPLVIIVVAIVIVIILSLATETTIAVMMIVIVLIVISISQVWLCLLNIAPLLQLAVLLGWLVSVILVVIWATSMGYRKVNFLGLSRYRPFFFFRLRFDIIIAVIASGCRSLTQIIEFVQMEVRCSCSIETLVCLMTLCVNT